MNAAVSISKAIAILLMVLAHSLTGISNCVSPVIAMFHMPLFFFMSGYCFKDRYLSDTFMFLKKRCGGVYWPFVKWCSVFLLLHNAFLYMHIYNSDYGFYGKGTWYYGLSDYTSVFFRIVLGMNGNEPLLGGYWFLHSLFVGSIFFYFTLRIFKRTVLGGAFLLLITTMFLFVEDLLPVKTISGRDVYSGFFIWLGYFYKSKDFALHKDFRVVLLLTFILILGSSSWPSSMLSLNIRDVVTYTLSATSGILFVLGLSSFLALDESKSSLLKYIGNNTLPILTWHFLCFKVVSFYLIFSYHLDIEKLADIPTIVELASKGYFIVYFIVGSALPLMLSFVSMKLFDRNYFK